jgi:peptide/nickel transport system ATP-binding protein
MFERPEHPYTWGLLRSIPRLDVPRDVSLVPIPGRPPSLIALPGGCSFHPRCPYARPRHAEVDPSLEPVPDDPGHRVACLLDPQARRRIWAQLRAGRTPEEARAELGQPAL